MAVADTDVNIFEDTDNSGNGGGGGGGIKKIESPDESINVTEDGDVTKVTVNWNEMPETEVTSEDGSVEVTKVGSKYDLSVPLATEERKGLLSPSGKYQIDHALQIKTNEQVSTANVAAGLLMNEDLEYYPEDGQMMTWRDLNGKLHLSRYEPNTPKNNGFGALNWRTAVYDAVNDSIIVESKSGDNASPASGKFFVTRSVNGGWTWTPYNDVDSPVENWGIGAYHNGTAVFISRNTSMEIEYTTDGGLTWTRTNLPMDTRWDSVWWDENGRWVFHTEDPWNFTYATYDFNSWEDVSSDYPSGCRCYFLPNDPTRYPYSGKTSDWMCMAKRTVFGMKQDVLMVKTSSGWQNFFSFGEGSNATRHFPIQIQVESYSGTVTKEHADLFVNDEGMAFAPILYLNSSLRYRINGESSDWWIFPTMISLRRNKIYAVVSNGTNIYNASGSITNSSSISLTKGDVVISGTEAVNFIPYGAETESIFTFGGVKHSDAGFRQSSFNLFLTIVGESVIATPPDFWREIPLLDENKTGLVYQEGNEAKTIELGNYLEKRTTEIGEEIGTVHSDRITPYANYMLRNSNGSVWCPVDVAYMVNGVTKIYSDEECTIEIGVVTNHSYNPNNPLDVEVSIGGVTEVYVIDQTKIPQSLATTKSVVTIFAEVLKRLILKITDMGANDALTDSDQIYFQGAANTTTDANVKRGTLSKLLTWIRTKLDIVYFKRGDISTKISSNYLYNIVWDNKLYCADARFHVESHIYNIESGEEVTGTGMPVVKQFFDGNFEHYYSHPLTGEKQVVTITAASQTSDGYLFGYGNGRLLVCFYLSKTPNAISLRYKQRNSDTWMTANFRVSSISTSIYEADIPWTNSTYINTFEITIEGKTNAEVAYPGTSIAQIVLLCPDNGQFRTSDQALVNKYATDQRIFGNVEMAKIIKTGGTSSQYLKANGDVATISTTPTSGSSNPITSGGVYTALQTKLSSWEGTAQAYSDLPASEKDIPNVLYVIK